MHAACPRHGVVLVTPGCTRCPLCGLPLLTNADGGYGLQWMDDGNRLPDVPSGVPSDRERQQRESREQHT
jgi:hypothetical protein